MGKRKIRQAKINTGSMADIAFLLLIFFLVATTMQTHQGLSQNLPPDNDQPKKSIPERNLFKVAVNSKNEILVRGAPFVSFDQLTEDARAFVLNYGQQATLSEHPEKAVISIKVDRGTRYEVFIKTLDAVQRAYYEIYGERVGLSAEEYRKLNTSIPIEKEKYEAGRSGIPMKISIAEPTNTKYYGAI